MTELTENMPNNKGTAESLVDRPLAERMRPGNLDELLGQHKAIGPGTLIRNIAENDTPFSMILWGPPGCGKTTLALILAQMTSSYFVHFSAVLSGVADIRKVIKEAGDQQKLHRRRTVLFVDEIHRFNKAQQDAFLHHVESGLITLIGATTENPSFEVISPLLSRCRVITLVSLPEDALITLIKRAMTDQERGLGHLGYTIDDDAAAFIAEISDGDGRTALNNLEAAASLAASLKGPPKAGVQKAITLENAEKAFSQKSLRYDKSGEEHYNLISAFHKSLRGSDPDAALYWLARMLEAGENPLYIARRMVRFASEDVGNADPNALHVAVNALESFRFLGHPEGELALAQAACYLATAPKSNSIYMAFKKAQTLAVNKGSLPVPLHIRNAPTKLMEDLGYSKGYKYAHNYKGGFTPQNYLPEEIAHEIIYHPTQRGYEKTVKQRLDKWRDLKKKK